MPTTSSAARRSAIWICALLAPAAVLQLDVAEACAILDVQWQSSVDLLESDSCVLERNSDTGGSSEPASDGLYMDLDTLRVYDHQRVTGTLTYVFTHDGTQSEDPEQWGECRYVGGAWRDADAQPSYGQCISFRVLGNAAREVDWRVYSRTITGATLKIDLLVDYNTSTTQVHNKTTSIATCTANTYYFVPLQDCIRPSAGGYGTFSIEVPPAAEGATHYCATMKLMKVEGTSTTELGRVTASCRAL